MDFKYISGDDSVDINHLKWLETFNFMVIPFSKRYVLRFDSASSISFSNSKPLVKVVQDLAEVLVGFCQCHQIAK